MDAVQYAVYGVGSIALMPLFVTAIRAAARARRDRRRAAMLDRFNARVGGY